MSLVEVTMYRVECDECDASPQDDSDYFAWASPEQPLEEAVECDYYVVNRAGKPLVVLCPEHAPRCASPACALRLRDDEHGDRCEDHAPEEPPA